MHEYPGFWDCILFTPGVSSLSVNSRWKCRFLFQSSRFQLFNQLIMSFSILGCGFCLVEMKSCTYTVPFLIRSDTPDLCWRKNACSYGCSRHVHFKLVLGQKNSKYLFVVNLTAVVDRENIWRMPEQYSFNPSSLYTADPFCQQSDVCNQYKWTIL